MNNRIYRPTLRKGTRIRVLDTGELGTIADKMLIRKDGTMRTYCKVRLDKKPKEDTWYFAEQLGDTKVKADVSIKATDDSVATFSVVMDMEEMGITLDRIKQTSINPNIPMNKTLSAWITAWLLKGIQITLKEAYGAAPIVKAEKWE